MYWTSVPRSHSCVAYHLALAMVWSCIQSVCLPFSLILKFSRPQHNRKRRVEAWNCETPLAPVTGGTYTEYVQQSHVHTMILQQAEQYALQPFCISQGFCCKCLKMTTDNFNEPRYITCLHIQIKYSFRVYCIIKWDFLQHVMHSSADWMKTSGLCRGRSSMAAGVTACRNRSILSSVVCSLQSRRHTCICTLLS